MKNILFTLALLISFSSFGQISILDTDQLRDKFPNGMVSYRDIDGDLLFDGKATEYNIGEFINHSDFSEISYYSLMAFEGSLLASNSVLIQYYCDKDGSPISVKEIRFKNYDEGCDCGVPVGTKIKYRRDGKIKSIDHVK